MIEREEALDAEMAATKNFLVQICTEFLEIIEGIGHCSSKKRCARE
jgi:hypothetical protein